jgi:RNA-directed DNA polymerase
MKWYNARAYWDKREYINARNSINGSSILTKLFRMQKGRCEYCSQSITDTQVRETTIHKHHLKPRSEGGDWKSGNLRLLHTECHRTLHGTYSRKEMASLISKGIDYLRLMKPATA